MDITGTVKLSLKADRAFTADLVTGSATLVQYMQAAFTNGTDEDEIDLVFADTVTDLAAEGVQSYNLDALTDPVTGGAVAFVRIRAIVIYSKAAANKVLTLGGVANAFAPFFGNVADEIDIPAGGIVCLTNPGAGWTVTPDTADILAITNAAGGTSSFDVYIFGASAAPSV